MVFYGRNYKQMLGSLLMVSVNTKVAATVGTYIINFNAKLYISFKLFFMENANYHLKMC